MRASAFGQSAGVSEKGSGESWGIEVVSIAFHCLSEVALTLIVWPATRVLMPTIMLWKLFGMPIPELDILDKVPLALYSLEITER
jgi:hypothetical protein